MAIDSDEKKEIIAAVVDLGQILRGEMVTLGTSLREELVAFKADVREDFAGVRRDIASLRRTIFEDITQLEDRVKDLERWKSDIDAEKKRAKG
jgi:hypothetical protein